MESGIYALISKTDNSKIYIGSAINLGARRKRHFRELASRKHFNQKLQNYYNKHGSDCFEFQIIQFCKPKYLISCEQFHIDVHKPYFNINPVAGSRLNSKHTAASRKKISDSWKHRSPISMFSRLFKHV